MEWAYNHAYFPEITFIFFIWLLRYPNEIEIEFINIITEQGILVFKMNKMTNTSPSFRIPIKAF